MEETPGNQSNFMSVSNKSTGRLTGGTTNQISSSNYSRAKTLIVYENDKSVEIKEEIIDDQQRHQHGGHSLLSENNQLDEKSISSVNESPAKTTSVYEYDLAVDIKEEIIQDQETASGQKIDKKYESTLNTVNTREADIFSAKKLRNQKEKKMQASKTKSKKKYKCQDCARSYKHKRSLNFHQKFECGVTPQFICKCCDKRFKQKGSMSRHEGAVHQKTDSIEKKQRIRESKLEPEKNHNMYRYQKTNLNISQTSYICDKCFRSYSSLGALKKHNRLKHAASKPQFVCDVCGYKTDQKSSLVYHISSRHFRNSKMSQARHKCDKCSRIYSWLCDLRRHERLEHAAVRPQFVCDVCDYKTNKKSTLFQHISSRHLKKSLQARHNCDKCCRSYTWLCSLRRHERLKHAAVNP